MGKLVHFQADGSPVEIRLDQQRITIGRRPDNDICLPYPAVSGEHAVILTILDDSFLEDLGSTNGTLVNGAAVAKYFLRDRDEIDIGRHILVYCADDSATVERPRAQATMSDAQGDLPSPPAPKPFPFGDGEPALKVVSGAKAGRIVALVKDETLIGRPGVQVVALRRTSDEVRVVPVEGASAPSVNGVRVVPQGQPLAIGDIVEVAGAKMEVIVPAKRTG